MFRATLETEKKMWTSGAPDRAAMTPDNYVFEDGGAQPDGLARLGVKPRRKDVLLVDGSIFLRPEDGDLVRMEARLSKSPSFWTRHVQIVRWYQRFVGAQPDPQTGRARPFLHEPSATWAMVFSTRRR